MKIMNRDTVCRLINILVPILLTSFTRAQMSSLAGRCTTHDYELSLKQIGYPALDNSPGWCGIRYSMLNIARITAVNGLDSNGCNQCLEVTDASITNGKAPKVYILAVDRKGDSGLDIARSSYEAIFPGKNYLDPQSCQWKVVDPSFCGKICVGTEGECGVGVRNLLPAYLLPEMPRSFNGLTPGSTSTATGSVSSDSLKNATSARIVNNSLKNATSTTTITSNSTGFTTTTVVANTTTLSTSFTTTTTTLFTTTTTVVPPTTTMTTSSSALPTLTPKINMYYGAVEDPSSHAIGERDETIFISASLLLLSLIGLNL